MKSFATLFILFAIGITSLWAAPSDGYYRFPTAYGNQVAFVADNDLWIAAIARQYDLPLATRDAHFAQVPSLRTVAW